MTNNVDKMDWKKWAEKHHVKIGDGNDEHRRNEVSSGGSVSGTKLAPEVSNYARTSNSCNLQKLKAKREVRQKEKQ